MISSDYSSSKSRCSFYKRGTCKYGISGKGFCFAHPRMCKKFMNHGNSHLGCKGCKKFHPKLCKKKMCDKKDCTAGYHLKNKYKRSSNNPKRKNQPRSHKNSQQTGAIPLPDNTNSFLEALNRFK